MKDVEAIKNVSRAGVDLLTGGFPCQPFSVAGKQKGKEDDRHLWPYMLKIIQEVRPRWIIGENVTGIINLALDQVLSEMEAEGYEATALIIPACAVDAPHRRDRVWIVANSIRGGLQISTRGGREESLAGDEKNRKASTDDISKIKKSGSLADSQKSTERTGLCTCWPREIGRGRSCNCGGENVSNPQSNGTQGRLQQFKQGIELGTHGDSQPLADTKKLQRNGSNSKPKCKIPKPGNSCCENTTTDTNRGESAKWSTEPNVGRVAHGIPRRVDRLKGLGNAILPQCVVPIMEAIKKIDAS